MAIKSDRWIRRMAEQHAMIEPFSAAQVREGVISYGVSSFGYGWVMIAAASDALFVKATAALGVPELARDGRFVDGGGDGGDGGSGGGGDGGSGAPPSNGTVPMKTF